EFFYEYRGQRRCDGGWCTERQQTGHHRRNDGGISNIERLEQLVTHLLIFGGSGTRFFGANNPIKLLVPSNHDSKTQRLDVVNQSHVSALIGHRQTGVISRSLISINCLFSQSEFQ